MSKIIVTRSIPHRIIMNGEYKGEIYCARPESKKLKYWAISCVSGLGFNTYKEARDYALRCVIYK